MNQGKYIFAQLTEFLPRRVFDGIVDKYEGNKRVSAKAGSVDHIRPIRLP
jgi:hypothetical protein